MLVLTIFTVAVVCFVVLVYQSIFKASRKFENSAINDSSDSTTNESENSRSIYNLANQPSHSDNGSDDSGGGDSGQSF